MRKACQAPQKDSGTLKTQPLVAPRCGGALPHSHLEIDITGRCSLNGRDVEGMLVLVVDQEGLRAKRRCRQQRANRLYFQHARYSKASPRYCF